MKQISDAEQTEKAKDQIKRAQYADQAMRNPLIREYFLMARAALFERFSASDKPQAREQIFLELQQLERFEKNFEKTILNGKLAENWLQKLTKRTKSALKR